MTDDRIGKTKSRFRVVPLGVNGLYATDKSATSSYLVYAGDKTIVLDFGSGALVALSRYIKPEEVDLIILTHFHFDHVSDMGTLGYYMQSRAVKVKVFCPGDDRKIRLFGLDKHFDVSVEKEGVTALSDEVTVEFLRVAHPVETYAVKIRCGGSTLGYTADTNVCAALDDIFSSSDLVIADSAFLYPFWSENKPHLSATHCARYAEKYGVKTLLSHFDPNVDPTDYLKEANAVTDKCELAFVGRSYDIG